MRQKNKTLIFSSSCNIWGGGEIYIEQLCHYMNTKNIQTYILTPEPKAYSCPTKESKVMLSKYKRLRLSFGIAKKYKQEGFKTIILNDISSLWLAPVFRNYGFKVISLLHLYLQKKSDNPLGHSWLEYHLIKFASQFCDEIFSVNKNNQKIFGIDRVKFIGNYVPNWFFNMPRNKKSKQFDFIIIARLAKQKNIPLFLDILKNINNRKNRKYNALIIGEGPEKENIEKIIFQKHLGDCVRLSGWVKREELPQIYDLGKVFVISSLHEGFATTLLEAHSRGLPAIVTSSSGFCSEFINGYNNITGIVFKPEDIYNYNFYKKVSSLVDEYENYEGICLKKSRVFSEDNVLKPIMEASIS